MTIKTVDIRSEDRDEFLAAVVPYLEELQPGWHPTPEWERSYFEDLRSEAHRWLWWAVVDGERVGFANFAAVQDQRAPATHVGELAELTIFPEHRRRGHGRALARAMVRKLLEFGVASIEATVRADDAVAIDFWRGLGFAPTATVLSLLAEAPEPGAARK
jgi:ribosomal protein S18 acetylase RimI-like enzyme